MTESDHMQLRILKSLRSVLLSANTDAGARVRVEGLNNLSASALPAIEIEVSDEEIERKTMGSGGRATLQRDLVVEVGCLVRGSGDYLERASALMAQVEEALFPEGFTELDCLLDSRPRLRGTRPQHDDRGADPVYRIRTGWVFRYFTSEGRPRAHVTTP